MNTENLMRSKKVLLVEDEPHWQMMILRTLRAIDQRISVRCVKSVKHAQQILFDDSSYDMIISDHYLEGKHTGLDLWRDCRERKHSIPFVVVSGIREEKFEALIDAAEALERPIYVAKPFEIERMRDILAAKLARTETPNWSSFNQCRSHQRDG